jgi:hypothetical protein
MRPLLAIAISVSLLGGVYLYTEFAKSVQVESFDYVAQFAKGEYTVELRRTFDAGADPVFSPQSIQVLLKGESVFSRDDDVLAEESIEFRLPDSVEVGENEIYVTANRKELSSALAVVQVIVKRDGIPIAETNLFSEGGLPMVSGSVGFRVKDNDNTESEDQHDH